MLLSFFVLARSVRITAVERIMVFRLIFRIWELLFFSEINLLPDDFERLKSAHLEHLIVCKEDNIMRIRTEADGTCAALEDGKCTIYDNRPAICRAYPLYLDMYVGVCALKECSGVPANMGIKPDSEALRSLLDIYQYWIDYYRNPKK